MGKSTKSGVRRSARGTDHRRIPSVVVSTVAADQPPTRHPGTAQTVVFAGGDPGDAWMATALFSMLADPTRAIPILAARLPSARALSLAVEVMRESDWDPSGLVVREPSTTLFGSADVVVTIGTSFRRELLAATPQHRREHWLIPERIGSTPLERERHARELIRSRVAMLVLMEGWERRGISRDKARVTRPRVTLDALTSA